MARRPLVSCIMATGGRRRFVPIALRCFARRTWRNAELVVVDDGERSVRSLCEGLPDVRYLRVRPLPMGTKLNLGIEAARGGILQKIDDDDYYGPRFLAQAVRHLEGRDPERTLVTRCCFLTLVGTSPVLRHSGHGWTPGGGFCFARELWRKTPFQDRPTSCDTHLLRDHRPEVVRICDAAQYVVVRHGANTWNRLLLKEQGVELTPDEYFRTLPRDPRTPGEVFDAETCGLYRRVLRWRR